MSSQIRAERDSYYTILESTQKGDMDITPWLQWFITCLNGALSRSENTLAAVLVKARFWERIEDVSLNERQQSMLNKLVDGFEGNLTSSKWAKIAKTSQDTAIRDIDDLVSKGILARGPAGGRSTSYCLVGFETR
jgi:Fic family protein